MNSFVKTAYWSALQKSSLILIASIISLNG